MSFFLSIAALVAAGLALLHLSRLATGNLGVDLALGWFVGGGWFATVVAGLRFLAGVPYTVAVAALVPAVPVLAWAARTWIAHRSRSSRATPTAPSRAAPRLRPRPLWLFGPMAGYVLIVAYATTVHGIDTPTQTDDGVRVRAFTPMLALDDGWSAEARQLLPMAGTVPTWVPSLAWRLTGRLDHFHVNYTVLTGFLCLLALLVSLGSSRGRPEQGWAGAFAALSLPLFVYHCTSTYTDAVLAIHVGAGFAFFLEYDRTRDPADAARALLLLVVAAFVKREGAMMAACTAGPLLLQLAWHRRAGAPIRFGWLLLLLLPLLVDLAAAAAAAGAANAFPVLRLAGAVSGVTEAAYPGLADLRARAAAGFVQALFRSGNPGMLYWVLTATVAARLPALLRSGRAMPLLALGGLFCLAAVSSVWLVPLFTLDNSTVHRALLTVSVPAAIWVASTLGDWAQSEIRSG